VRVNIPEPEVKPILIKGRAQSTEQPKSLIVPEIESQLRLLSHMALYLGTWISGIQEYDTVEAEIQVLEKFSDMFKVHVVAPTDHFLDWSDSSEDSSDHESSACIRQASRGRINSVDTGTRRPDPNPFHGCLNMSTRNEFCIRNDTGPKFEGYSGRQCHLGWYSFKHVRLLVLLSYPGYNWEPILTKYIGLARYFTELNQLIATIQL